VRRNEVTLVVTAQKEVEEETEKIQPEAPESEESKSEDK
jgi:hypothetical protein